MIYLKKKKHKVQSRNIKGAIFDPRVNAKGPRYYCPSRMKVSNCTFRFGVIIQRDLRTLSLSPRDNQYACVIWVHTGKQLTLNEIIWRA